MTLSKKKGKQKRKHPYQARTHDEEGFSLGPNSKPRHIYKL